MKKFILFLILAILPLNLSAKSISDVAESSKILIAYFSLTGTTEEVAFNIKEFLPTADLFEIATVKVYPEGYTEVHEVGREEQKNNARPELKQMIDTTDYDIIFLGFPIWFETVPMAIFTFMEAANLENKIIIPFTTHGGSGIGNSVFDIKKTAENSEVKKAIAIKSEQVGRDSTANDIKDWINKLEF